jgi:hypothetical protein
VLGVGGWLAGWGYLRGRPGRPLPGLETGLLLVGLRAMGFGLHYINNINYIDITKKN